MKKFLSLLLAVSMIAGVVFALPITAGAMEVDESQTYSDESMINVYVDVSAVAMGEDTFWACIWDDSGEYRWAPLEDSEVGYLVVRMRAGEYVIFTRINSGEQPGWISVNHQTRDTRYTGTNNFAILSYAYNSGIMDIEWKYINNADKSELKKVMCEAEKYLNEEANTYTAKSIADLQICYADAQECYKKLSGQFEVNEVVYYLRDAIFSLELTEGYDSVDKNQLSFAISTAISYYMSLDKFTGYSWGYMLDKLEDAQTVDRNKKAPQRAVDFAAQELFEAIDSLERVEDSKVMGDVNGDYYVNVMDATAIQCHLSHLEAIDMSRYKYADTDKDGKVNVMDATMIQRFIAQLIPQL